MTNDVDRLKRIVRSHSARIQSDRKEMAMLRGRLLRVEGLLTRCESRGVLVVPVSIVRDALDQCGGSR